MSEDALELPEAWKNPIEEPEPPGIVTHSTPPPPDGIYPGVPYETYASWDALNAHIINQLNTRTPAHVHYEIMHGGKEPTKATGLGWFTHVAVLEHDRFAAEYVVPPKVDRRFKAGKETWAQFLLDNPGKEIIDGKDYFGALSMREALLNHETSGEFLRNQGISELSIVWTDAETGIRCKARIDRQGFVGQWPITGDLKTADNASRSAFEKSIKTYGYHTQAVHYLTGLNTLRPVAAGDPFRRYVFFVVESKAPYLVAVWEIAEEALQVGADERRRALLRWKQCRETGQWPGYYPGIDLIGLPAWAYKAHVPDAGE